MNKFVLFATLALAFTSCANTPNTSAEAENDIDIVDFSGIEPLLNKNTDTLYIVNFWATWCAPCVKEIPYFEQIAQEYSKHKLKVILVNLDFPNHYQSRLLPFVKEQGIKSDIVMLDDPDANSWINRVDSSWSGSIPATLIYNDTKREFFEKEFTYQELKDAVESFYQ